MSVSVQESLLDVCDEPSPGPFGTSVRRTLLAHGAWVDLRPGWLAGSGAVFGRLAEVVPWRAEKRHMYDKVVAVPRLLCFYSEDAALPDPVLTAVIMPLASTVATAALLVLQKKLHLLLPEASADEDDDTDNR